jgi:zinc transport system permease protein
MLPEFLEYSFMQRALVAGVVTALICPPIGVFLVPRRLSLMADTLAHMALAGVAFGLFLGISPLLGAFVATVPGRRPWSASCSASRPRTRAGCGSLA